MTTIDNPPFVFPERSTAPPAPTTGLIAARCDPYGAESGGPKKLLGGLYGPENVGKIMWHCQNPAISRFKMVCRCGHKGQPMPLCGSHRAEIGRRQSDLCPACAWPPEARALHETVEVCQRDIQTAFALGRFQMMALLEAKAEAAGYRMNELSEQGVIHKCGLTLEEVS
jgi:hypothetical protein